MFIMCMMVNGIVSSVQEGLLAQITATAHFDSNKYWQELMPKVGIICMGWGWCIILWNAK